MAIAHFVRTLTKLMKEMTMELTEPTPPPPRGADGMSSRLRALGMDLESCRCVRRGLDRLCTDGGVSEPDKLNAELQICQLYASGLIGGDEVRSIVENVPGFIRLLRKEAKLQYGMVSAHPSDLHGKPADLITEALRVHGMQ